MISELVLVVDYRTPRGSWGPFLENPGNLLSPMSVFGGKYFLTEVNFC